MTWTFNFQGLIPLPSLVTLLEKHFFPKWLQALSTWLNGNPDFDEVTKWYTGWKSLFSESLLRNSFIQVGYDAVLFFKRNITVKENDTNDILQAFR